jgi:hypothetical protein
MIFAMGAGDRLVGVGNFDRFPPETGKLRRASAACSIPTPSESPRAQARRL